MKIRTRVKIAGTMTVFVLLAYGAGVLHLDRTLSNLAQEIRETNELVNKITILRNLTQDYLLYRTERAQRQWSALYDEVLRLLESPEHLVLKGEYGLGDASQKLKAVGDTFARLITVQQTGGPDHPEKGAREELRSRLATQLLLATQDLLTWFFSLTEEVHQKLIRTQRLMALLDILALLSLGLIIVSAGVFLQRSVVKPVLKLHQGAEIVGAGNLDHQVGSKNPDEVGELTRAFDRMTVNLKEITVSRDELAAEIEVRKRAETRIARQNAIMAGIGRIFKEALTCETEEQLGETALSVAEELTGSKFGFIDELNPEGLLDAIAISDLGWEACKIPGTDKLVLPKNLHIRGIFGACLQKGRPEIINDPAAHPDRAGTPEGHPLITAFLGAPLKRGGKIIGMIGLANKEGGYTDADREAVEALATALVEALMGKRAEADLHKSLQRLDLLAETAGRLLAAESPQQVVDSLCRKVMDFLDCDAFFNFLVMEERAGFMRLNACAGIPEEEAKEIQFLEYGVAVCGCAARDACRIVAEDIQHTPDPRTQLVKSYGIQAYACHPLVVEGRVLGTLSFGTCKKTSFASDELGLMKAVADQVAIAMARKLSEDALRESEEHYRSLFDHMLDGFAYCRMHFEQNLPVDFTYLKVNESFETLTGLKNVIGKKVSEVIPGIRESNPELFEIYGRVALTGKPERFEIYLDPLKMWLSISVYSPQKDYFVAVFDVITARKQAEEETQRLLKVIQLEKEKLTALVNSISDEIWFADTQKKFTLANPSALREFGLDSAEEIDVEKLAASLEVYHADGSPRSIEEAPPLLALQGEHVRNVEEIIRTPATGELRHRQVSSSPVRDAKSNIIGSVTVVRDITARKQAEEKIKHLASFPEMNPAPVLELDLSGAIIYHNQAAVAALEKMGPEAQLRDLIPGDLEEIVAAAREKQENFFYREVKINHTVFAQNIFHSEAFNVLRIYTMDISERKQAEEKLQATLLDLERSNRDLEEFAYVASHDLQEPLRKIANFSEMLGEQYRSRLGEDADRYLGYIADGAKRMQALINDLLSYSRVGRADFPSLPASLEDILQGTLNDLQALIQESGARITHDPLPTSKVNSYQIGQLLQNLLVNAIKFHGDHSPRIHISARQEGHEWVIGVRDEGIGFDSQQAERIFKVFQRLHPKEKYPGTGIGLSICKKIVERHGGRCWAESQPGRGATFFFTIPA